MILLSTNAWGIIIGVASIVIAILIYFLQKQIRYPGQLKFSIIETWKVRRSSPNGYGDLSLKYNDYEIEEELSYVKFIVYNRKSYDYSSGGEGCPVRIIVPEGCKWIDAKIVGYSKDVQADIVNEDGKELNLTFNLLRKNEYVEMDGLLESKSKVNLRNIANHIEVKHRIPNVSSVKSMTLLDAYDYKEIKHRITLFGFMFAMMFFILFYAIVINPASPLKFKEISTGETLSLYVNREGEIVYHNGIFIWNKYSNPISKEEFDKKYEPIVEPSSLGRTDYYYLGFFLIIFILLLYVILRWSSVLLKNKEIKRIMKDV